MPIPSQLPAKRQPAAQQTASIESVHNASPATILMAAEMKSPTASAAESGDVVRGPSLPQAVPTSAKTYLVTLPQELILEVIKHCVPPRSPNSQIIEDRTIAISQLSLVDKSLREMCVPILFRILKLSTNHAEILGHIQVLESSRILEIVQHLSIVSSASGNATPSWEPSLPPRLATLLGHMPNLRDLNLALQYRKDSLATAVQDELLKQRIAISAVKKFKYNMSDSMGDPLISVSFIPAVFTGLCALHLDLGMTATPNEVPGLSTIAPSLKLHTLSLHSEFWFSESFDQIHKLFPNITKLIIGGEVGDVMISESIPTIKKFRNLRSLALTDLISFSFDEDDLRESLREVREACPCPNCYLTDDMDLVCEEDEESEGVSHLRNKSLLTPQPSTIPMDIDKESPGISVGSACVGDPDRSVTIPAFHSKTYLVTLPGELVLEIINHCVKTGENMPRKKRDVIQLSLVTKALRELCIPFIFTTMQLRTSYPNLLSKIQAINSDRFLRVVEHLEIRLFTEIHRGWAPETSAALAKLLGNMPSVSDLCLSMAYDPEFSISLQGQLRKYGIVLPAIKKLQFHSRSSWKSPSIVDVFTGLDSLHLDLGYNLSLSDVFGMSEAPSSLRLKTVSLKKKCWALEDVSEIYSFFPDVTELILGGTIDYDLKLSEFLPVLKPFRGLTLLALTDLIDPPESLVRSVQEIVKEFCDLFHDGEEDEIGNMWPRQPCHTDHYLEAREMVQGDHELKEDQA
ncbi:F-box domain-containing protein [Colletotrichum camelliae]|nr:F-box domain-containing protein [Colletotrichum camelliae]